MLLISGAVAQAQPGKVPRTRYLSGGSLSAVRTEPFRQGLRDLGYVDLPVEQPTKFEFVINLKAAKQIGQRFRRM
jgi:hypothetical protein